MSIIHIDTYRCSGCATCTTMCPDVFVLNPLTEKAELINPNQELSEAIRQAAAFCPEKCIILTEDNAPG
jgi:ferredoxin